MYKKSNAHDLCLLGSTKDRMFQNEYEIISDSPVVL